jgi:hypothetical protein
MTGCAGARHGVSGYTRRRSRHGVPGYAIGVVEAEPFVDAGAGEAAGGEGVVEVGETCRDDAGGGGGAGGGARGAGLAEGVDGRGEGRKRGFLQGIGVGGDAGHCVRVMAGSLFVKALFGFSGYYYLLLCGSCSPRRCAADLSTRDEVQSGERDETMASESGQPSFRFRSRWLRRRVLEKWHVRAECSASNTLAHAAPEFFGALQTGVVPSNRELSPWLSPVARAMIVSSTWSLTTEPPMPLAAHTSSSDRPSPLGDASGETEGERNRGMGCRAETSISAVAHFLDGVTRP